MPENIGLIPLVDLARQHEALLDEIQAVTRDILEKGAFIGGPHVEAFEREWAGYCGTSEAIGVCSGTDALRFALLACGVRPGDEVITPPHTFVATWEAIVQSGARPVPADVDPETCNLDPAQIERRITVRTRAILPVHLYGRPACMDAICDIAATHGLAVIEDAAQAHGASSRGRKTGSLGRAGSFSFYPSKNLGACGEAGAVTTDNADVARTVRMLRDHGQEEKNLHEIGGYNGRLDAIQAAILRIKLRRLDAWNLRRRALAALYSECLAGIPGLALPSDDADATQVYHLYVVQTFKRDELRESLRQNGIATGLHYPLPVHLQKAFRFLGYKTGDFPVSERMASEVLSLPLYPELEAEKVEFICEMARSFLLK